MKTFKYLMLFGLILSLFGCGGGGGGGATQKEPDPVPVTPTAAVVKISTQGNLPEATSLAGVGITVSIPVGVTVKTENDGTVSSSVITPSGVTADKATIAPADYVPATATTPGTLTFVLASTDQAGFRTGEFVTVNLEGAVSNLNPTDITLTNFQPVNLAGEPVAGLAPTHTLELK
ncbi:hypothetical protein [Geobacter sp. DSM 9736]|uniref:hypothetical protein n=1 Tax=Geobacter sp. DSM 9736 TaxID=1277350 RepID=UPI000B512886|nr:hypothetical protein [Geobacter sp. DSM 9736]SNB46047.1 hypothetical protein SAMN06269301_1485 [Geobacter sp. DSM 9736]